MHKHKDIWSIYHVIIHVDHDLIFSRNKLLGKWSKFKLKVRIKYPDIYYKHKISASFEDGEIIYNINWPSVIEDMVKNNLL